MQFGRAARSSHVIQSTLSADINELESVPGTPLLERTYKQVLLTEIGKNILQRASNILTQIDEPIDEASSASAPLSRILQFGIIPAIAPFVLPGLLSGLRKDYPGLQLLIREDLSQNLVQRLQKGELVVILLALPYPVSKVSTRHLFDDPFLLTCPQKHPLNKNDTVSVQDLKGQDIPAAGRWPLPA